MSAGPGNIFITDQWYYYYYYYYYYWGGGLNVWSHTSGNAATNIMLCYQRNVSRSISYCLKSKAVNLQNDANHTDVVIPLSD